MKKYKIMSVFGTRPEAIKMAPLVKELSRYEDLESICCLTGQHREMLDSVMEIFQLQGDFDLNIMEKRHIKSRWVMWRPAFGPTTNTPPSRRR